MNRGQKELGSSLHVIPFSIVQIHRHDLGELKVRVGHCDLNLMERIERSPLCLVDFLVGLSKMDYWNNAEGNGLPLVTNTRLSLSIKGPSSTLCHVGDGYIRFWRERNYPSEE